MPARAPTTDFANDPYAWEGQVGWKKWRTLRPFRGMYHDIRRRLPYYRSDITDGFNYRTMVATVRIYFVNLLPALAFQLDMTRNTNNSLFGINEALFSSALAGLVFSLLSAQPLTVVGITGLISLFNYTIYDIAVEQGIEDLYPQFIAWCAIWAAITHWMTAIFNWCDYMRYITDFSSQSFAMYVGIIYMIKGVEELINQFDAGTLPGGYLSCVIALAYWFTVSFLENTDNTIYARGWVRKTIADFAYPLATIFWTGFAHFPGRLTGTELEYIPHTRAFYPTVDRSWLIDFWNLPVKWVFVALPIGILLTLLFYYDHNVSSLGAQAKNFPLTKPAGFHWDFFLLGCTCFIGGIIGVPLPNGLVPQAPVHTDSCTEYADKLEVVHTTPAPKPRDPDSKAAPALTPTPTVHHQKRTVAVEVKEQRLSHFIMTLALIGTMTGPLLVVLHTMPRALFSGVFFVVGFPGIYGNQITNNIRFVLRERAFIDPAEPRLKLKNWRILYYVFWQIMGVGWSVGISQTIGAIGFPVIICSLIPLRWVVLPRIFSEEELGVLDAPTADADVVLASMGGRPEMPEVVRARRVREMKGEGEGGEGVQTGESGDGNGNGNGGSSSGVSEGSRAQEGIKSREKL